MLGFDPIFWLHHANVDRHLSLWQAIHPGVWVAPGPEREGSMGFAPGTQLDKDSRTSTCILSLNDTSHASYQLLNLSMKLRTNLGPLLLSPALNFSVTPTPISIK